MWRFYEAIPHKARSGRREPATDEPRLCDWGGAKPFLSKKRPRKAGRGDLPPHPGCNQIPFLRFLWGRGCVQKRPLQSKAQRPHIPAVTKSLFKISLGARGPFLSKKGPRSLTTILKFRQGRPPAGGCSFRADTHKSHRKGPHRAFVAGRKGIAFAVRNRPMTSGGRPYRTK